MPDITYNTVKFPDGFVNVAYEAGVAIAGGAATAFTAGATATGSLPPGLVVDATHNRITGVPTAAGTFTFTLSITDTAGAVTSGSYSITIHNAAAPGVLRSAPLATQLKVQWPTEF